MIGEFSKYKRITVTNGNTEYLQFQNPLNVDPKLVIITCSEDDPAYTTEKAVRGAVLLFGGYGAYDTIVSGLQSAVPVVKRTSSGGGLPVQDSTYGYVNGEFRLNRYTATYRWLSGSTYIVDIYA